MTGPIICLQGLVVEAWSQANADEIRIMFRPGNTEKG